MKQGGHGQRVRGEGSLDAMAITDLNGAGGLQDISTNTC